MRATGAKAQNFLQCTPAAGQAHGRSDALHRKSVQELPRGNACTRVLGSASAHIEDGRSSPSPGAAARASRRYSTLISGIDSLDSGRIVIDGREVSSLGEPQRTLFRRAHVGFVYQFFNLIATLDVEENVRLVLELNGVRGREAQQRTRAMLAHVGLDDARTAPSTALGR